MCFFFFSQKTAYEMRISDWSSGVCSSDLRTRIAARHLARSTRGAVMLEMAFAIPFLVLVGFGGLEIANLTLAHTRVSQLGLNTADNAHRQSIVSGTSVSDHLD